MEEKNVDSGIKKYNLKNKKNCIITDTVFLKKIISPQKNSWS